MPYNTFSTKNKCLFCDSQSLKNEGLCSLCKWERWQLPRKKTKNFIL